MAKKTRQKPRAASNLVVVLSVLLLFAVVLALASFIHNTYWKDRNERFLLRTVEQQILVPQIGIALEGASRAEEGAFGRLEEKVNAFEEGLAALKGGAGTGLPVAPREVSEELGEVEANWRAVREVADALFSSRETIAGFGAAAKEIGALLPELAGATEDVAELSVEKGSRRFALVAAQQTAWVERIGRALDDLLRGGTASEAAIGEATKAAGEFAQNLDDLQKGNPQRGIEPLRDPDLRAQLAKVTSVYRSFRDGFEELKATMPAVTSALGAAERAETTGADLGAALRELAQAYRANPGRLRVGVIQVGPVTTVVFAGLALLLLVTLALRLHFEARRREAQSKAISEANQQSILRLLDEMGDLADGDLTVEATVTEDITGAIADSINYAVEALRNLVTTINDTSDKVTQSAQETRKTTLELAEASDVQTRQIANATEAIMAMTHAIDEVANNATESAEVASRSVEVASRGAQTVRDTIAGMDVIREQIQETSKRIKRLGESSQEIGEIVELIDDIADQTNILALNAAMQAAMAGESGRGFAVVADEVQSLAERSRNATKQIEALVRTIQADTNEAVSSMETSTAGVVEGATLAENAGDALREIENVSTYIADLTRRIADSAQNQSKEAGKINATVTAIKEITRRNAEGTRRTADSVETLAELAVELQRSVAGFRLP